MNEKRYVFHINTATATVQWDNLTKAQAVRLYNLTEKNPPVNALSWGWSEEK